MDFHELLAMLQNPGEEGPPETIYDDLGASYTEATSSRDAQIEGHTSRIAEQDAAAVASAEAYATLEAENVALKAMNFDFIMAAQGTPPEDPTPEDSTPTDDDALSVDDLF